MTGSLVAARRAARNAARDGWRDPDPATPAGPATAAGAENGAAPLLTVSGLSLSYGRLRALYDIDLSVRSGELVALAGENGAGKTTLVRCIAGDVVPASGEIYLGGKRVPPDPGGAARLGVAVVWQDLALCDNLDIAANIMLGQEPKRLMLSETRFHAAAWRNCSKSCASRCGTPRATCEGCPAASASWWRWPGPWAAGHGCWPWTSRPPTWASRNQPRSKS